MDNKPALVFATNNAHKLDEVRAILGDRCRVLSLSDIGCHEEIPETGSTLRENALQKALYVSSHYGCDCFADDTGLMCDALGGEPGVRSARYAPGAGHDDKANMRLLLANMEDKDNRNARFVTVIALVAGGEEHIVEGFVEGTIAREPRGDSGFGYDPVFVPAGGTVSFAQMTAQDKNAISHRRRATDRLVATLRDTGFIK